MSAVLVPGIIAQLTAGTEIWARHDRQRLWRLALALEVELDRRPGLAPDAGDDIVERLPAHRHAVDRGDDVAGEQARLLGGESGTTDWTTKSELTCDIRAPIPVIEPDSD